MASGIEFDFSSCTGFLHDTQAYVSSPKASSGSLIFLAFGLNFSAGSGCSG
jgi:hypothetical protein